METRSYLSDSGNREASALYSLQMHLLDITDSNISEVVEFCVSSIFVENENQEKELVYNIMNTLIYRPLNAITIAKFVNELLMHEKVKNSAVKKILLTKISAPAYCDLSHLVFYRKLLDLKTYTEEDVVNQIEFFYFNFPPAVINHIILFAWFTPEIERHNKEHYNRIINFVSNTHVINSRPDILHFFENLESFKQNNYELWNECMRDNDQPDSLALKIRNDDLEGLMQFVAEKGDFDFNQRVPPFMFGVSSFLTCFPTLAEYAAFVGATKCLKYIIDNGADIKLADACQTTIAQFAVAGGNLEIINFLDGKVSFDGCLSTAAKFFRNDIYKWLEAEKGKDPRKPDLKNLSAMHYAAESGNIEILLRCLDNGLSVNFSFKSGWTPLHIASKNGQFPTIRVLCSHQDIKVSKTDAKGWTALHWAANNCHPESCRVLLLNSDCDINAVDNEGQAPLHWASTKGYPEVIRALLAHDGINVNIRNNDGSSPLHMAAMKGNVGAVHVLVTYKGIDVNNRDYTDATPLYLACENGQVEVVNELLSCPDINVNQPDNFGETPLFAASSLNNPRKTETIAALLKHEGINVNAVNSRGTTPLHACAENSDEEAVKLLLSRPEIIPNVRDNFGWTPLHSASSVGNYEAIKALIENGKCDVNATDASGKTSLFWAISAARNESESFDPIIAVKLLLPLTDVNIKNIEGKTVLHIAMEITNTEILEELLKTPSLDVNIQDEKGDTALHIAITENNEDAVDMLLNKPETDVYIQNSDGRTPLHIAAQSGSKEILAKILEKCKDLINARDKSSATPLMLAVESGSQEKVQLLVDTPGVDINIADGTGRSPRVNALRRGFAGIASILAKARTVNTPM